jgi:hypothetical protein
MVRVKIWVSAVGEVSNALIIEHANGSLAYFALRIPAGGIEWLGSGYRNPLFGCEGNCYDLPRGFPVNNADAARRLLDPSISKKIQDLIRLNFPLRLRPQSVSRPRQIA